MIKDQDCIEDLLEEHCHLLNISCMKWSFLRFYCRNFKELL